MNVHWLRLLGALPLFALCASALTPTKQGIAYGTAGSTALTMDYYAGGGVGAHPIVIAVTNDSNGANFAEAFTQNGYHVFVLPAAAVTNNGYAVAVERVERSIRYVRFHARDWNGDSRRMALVGAGAAGANLSLIVGLTNASGVLGSDDEISRESARVQGVVSLLAGQNALDPAGDYHATLDPLLKEMMDEAALARSSADYVNADTPRFLLIEQGSAKAAQLQQSLRKVGVRCDVINATGDQAGLQLALDWLNKTFDRQKNPY